jgi:hypothetical protein
MPCSGRLCGQARRLASTSRRPAPCLSTCGLEWFAGESQRLPVSGPPNRALPRRRLSSEVGNWISGLPGEICVRTVAIRSAKSLARSTIRPGGVTRAAGSLRKRKLIRYRRGKCSILDGQGLEAAACECYAVFKATYASPQNRRFPSSCWSRHTRTFRKECINSLPALRRHQQRATGALQFLAQIRFT